MGGQQGKAQIQVTLDLSSIIAGENITGSISLVISKPIMDVIVAFKLTGKETCSFRQTDLRNEGKVKIIDYTSIIYNSYGNAVKPGNYSLPFSITSPPHIPGTFVPKSRKYEARIAYFVKAEIFEQQKSSIGKHKVPILIKQCINANRYSLINNDTVSLSSCQCFSRGQGTLTAHLNKNAYLPGETANIWVEVDNSRSRSTMKLITIRLFQVLRLISNQNVSFLHKKLMYCSRHKVRIGGGDTLLGGNALSVDIPIEFKNINLAINGTTDGKLVQCKFEVEVISSYGILSSNGPSLEIPLMIYPKESIPTPLASAPEEWNPIELPRATLQLDRQANYY